jgi:hypothetical protein
MEEMRGGSESLVREVFKRAWVEYGSNTVLSHLGGEVEE